LLENPLDPTRGADSSVYSLFQQNLGIFDLAGQENEDWFSKDKEIFKFANSIICVLDINSHIKDIIEFIDNILELYEEMKLNCKVIILLHKIDLIDSLYLRHKLEHLNNHINNKNNNKIQIKVYTTSITKEFFFDLFYIFSDIISEILKHEKIILKESDIQDFKLDLNILLNYEISKDTTTERLFYDFNLNTEESVIHLLRLQDLGFLKYNKESRKFHLTEKTKFLKPNLNGANESEKKLKTRKILESLYILSNLKKV